MSDTAAFTRTETGLYVPRSRRYSRPVAVDLFAGCGGMSLGFHQAGFHVVAALEFDATAATVYMVNLARPGVQIHFDTDERRRQFERVAAKAMGVKLDRDGNVVPEKNGKLKPIRTFAGSGWISHYGCPGCDTCLGIGYDGKYNEYLAEINKAPAHPDGCDHFWVADIRNVTGGEILRAIGLGRGEVDCVMGGPPCQGFSTAGKRNVMDPRNSLVFEFARLVLEIQPKTMLFENVPGILSMVTPEGVPVVDAFCRVLEDGGFGTFDSLKRGLLASSGSGAALRGGKRVDRKAATRSSDPVDESEGDEYEEQLELFA